MLELFLAIWLEAIRVGVDPRAANCVCYHESEFRVDVVGDQGRAVGLWQWHLPSWKAARRMMGLPETDLRHDATESTRTALWAMANGYEHWWSTWDLCEREK